MLRLLFRWDMHAVWTFCHLHVCRRSGAWTIRRIHNGRGALDGRVSECSQVARTQMGALGQAICLVGATRYLALRRASKAFGKSFEATALAGVLVKRTSTRAY